MKDWNGVAMMREGELGGAMKRVERWSDASGSWGCGDIWEIEWLQIARGDWPSFGVATIAAKELLPIVMVVATWGPQLRGHVVNCHCDNEAVVASLRGGYCKELVMAYLLRCLFFLVARYQLTVTAQDVAEVDNRAADAISRDRLGLFFDLCRQVHHKAAVVSRELVERQALDTQWTSETWRSWLATLLWHQ